MGRKLHCHTSLKMEGQEHFNVVKGKVYDIISETDKSYMIITDLNDEHTFTKNPDEYGLSYKNWFYTEEEFEEKKENDNMNLNDGFVKLVERNPNSETSYDLQVKVCEDDGLIGVRTNTVVGNQRLIVCFSEEEIEALYHFSKIAKRLT